MKAVFKFRTVLNWELYLSHIAGCWWHHRLTPCVHKSKHREVICIYTEDIFTNIYVCVYIYTYIKRKGSSGLLIKSYLSVIPWNVAFQGPLFMGLPRREYWSGLLFLSPGDLPNPGIEPSSPALQLDSLPLSLI